jgi:hypothetical protein
VYKKYKKLYENTRIAAAARLAVYYAGELIENGVKTPAPDSLPAPRLTGEAYAET